MKKIVILPEGVCCDQILVEVDDGGSIRDVEFIGGCDGNGKALARLLQGMPAAKAADILAGVDCEGRGTSCADQFSRGVREQVVGMKARSDE